jgi:hypothetical protein
MRTMTRILAGAAGFAALAAAAPSAAQYYGYQSNPYSYKSVQILRLRACDELERGGSAVHGCRAESPL